MVEATSRSMSLEASPVPDQVAAVDLGSNSFHLVVARHSGGQLAFVERRKESVRIAAGLDRDGNLTPEVAERALECLQRFGQQLRHMPAAAVRAVGTNTLRRARNSASFLRAARRALGHPVEVISGIEEARLIYLGVAGSLAGGEGRRLVVDIGGGSTELIIGEGPTPVLMESLYIGCVGMSLRHFSNGVKRKRWKRAELEALQELEHLQVRFRELSWHQAVGSSGTVRAIASVARAAGWSNGEITPTVLERLRDTLLQSGGETPRLDGLSAERAPVFPGGVVVLLAVFRALGIERMEVANGALREGVLYDLLGRLQLRDPRERSAAALASRYQVDAAQAARVEETARVLLAQVASDWDLEDEQAARILRWAARLHEIGLDVAHSHYHKHSAYIVSNADLPGFSLQEQQLVAAIVRGHRRKLSMRVLDELPDEWRRPVERLAALLRVSVSLHRSRSPEPLPQLTAAVGKRSLTLVLPASWWQSATLAVADLRLAARYLDGIGFTLRLRVAGEDGESDHDLDREADTAGLPSGRGGSGRSADRAVQG
jgi:exopolyphosphatase / guanosine-5'-triphosphate,3'-diphosphate pyrophosphatase